MERPPWCSGGLRPLIAGCLVIPPETWNGDSRNPPSRYRTRDFLHPRDDPQSLDYRDHEERRVTIRPCYVPTSCAPMGLTRSGSYLKWVRSPPDPGNCLGNLTGRTLVCEQPVCKMDIVSIVINNTSIIIIINTLLWLL